MVLTKTPICNFGEKTHDFHLKGIDEKNYKLNDCTGINGTIIMFICNHCPYVKAIIKDLVKDINELKNNGIETVAIMSNDTKNYPEDSFVNMLSFSKINRFNFPYLFDEKQEVAKKFGAVCTPDFFGYNKNLRLQYRGRFRELRELTPVKNGESELKSAMMIISKTQNGPKEQIPSMGCNIKWIK
jgi:peroxiredoxin